MVQLLKYFVQHFVKVVAERKLYLRAWFVQQFKLEDSVERTCLWKEVR